MGKSYISQIDAVSYNVKSNLPIDTRFVVDSESDLYKYDTFQSYYYIGLVVAIKGTNDLFVLTSAPTSMPSKNWASKAVWKKVGGSDFNPEDYVEYYSQQLGARVVDSADKLDTLPFTYEGQFVVVSDNPDTSENEGGLYILTHKKLNEDDINVWQKVVSGSSSSSSMGEVVVDDIPTNGNGLAIMSKSDEVVEVYADKDHPLEANTPYTSRGLNTSSENGSGDLGDVDYITLHEEGNDSYIQLFKEGEENWMKIYIPEGGDIQGNTINDICRIDKDGNVYPMDGEELLLKPGEYVSFNNGLDFTGMLEQRLGDAVGNERRFGEDGSTYEDIDIYTVNDVPKVYAYINNEAVEVMTKNDKDEIINIINTSIAPEVITEEEISNMMDETWKNGVYSEI